MGDANELSFSGIWFLESKNAFGNFKLAAMDDIGDVGCTESGIVFKGRKKTSVIRNITSLAYGKQGRDFYNNWIRITYGGNESTECVYIADGRFLGWSGVFGGTKKMYKALSELLLK